MSGCQFVIPFTVSLTPWVEKARTAVEGQGGSFQGDESSGSFDVTIMGNHASGSYRVLGNELHVKVDNKPFFVPCSSIENYLVKQLSGE